MWSPRSSAILVEQNFSPISHQTLFRFLCIGSADGELRQPRTVKPTRSFYPIINHSGEPRQPEGWLLFPRGRKIILKLYTNTENNTEKITDIKWCIPVSLYCTYTAARECVVVEGISLRQCSLCSFFIWNCIPNLKIYSNIFFVLLRICALLWSK